MTAACDLGSSCRYSHGPSDPEQLENPAKTRANAKAARRREKEAQKKREKEERARRQIEGIRRQLDFAREITREVRNCLVTFGAGLEVRSVVASFDVVRERILDLSEEITVQDLVNLFTARGIDDTSYLIRETSKQGGTIYTIVSYCAALPAILPILGNASIESKPTEYGDVKATSPTFSLIVHLHLPSSTPESALDRVQAHLETKAQALGLVGLERDVNPSQSSRGGTKLRFTVTLDSWEHARDLRDELQKDSSLRFGKHRVQSKKFSVPFKYHCHFSVHRPQYNVQKLQWDDLEQCCKEGDCELAAENISKHTVRITLSGNYLSAVGPMRVRAEQLAEGTTVGVWSHRLLATLVAEELTADLQAEVAGALVRVDRRSNCLKVYGSSAAIDEVRPLLESYMEQLKEEEYTRELSPPETVRFFVEKGLLQLTETYGEEAVTIDLTSSPKKITVTGDEEIRHRLDQLFDDSFKDWADTIAESSATDRQCPICMCDAIAPTTIACDHVYCTPCLTHFVKSSLESTSFPLTCLGDGATCSAPIPISILEKFLPASKFQQLLETAFHTYMERHPDALSPCRTPGCAQLFKKDANGSADGTVVVTCPSCFISACAACAKTPHEGISCATAESEEYMSGIRNPYPEIRVSSWSRIPIPRTYNTQL